MDERTTLQCEGGNASRKEQLASTQERPILYLLSMKLSKLAQAVVLVTCIQTLYGLNINQNADISIKVCIYFSSVLSGAC